MSTEFTWQVVIGVPLITAFIGYLTNWAAVKMIFLPREFIGVGKLGWQGVVPARNDKFANDIADSVGNVISARELTERLNPAEMEAEMSDRLDEELPTLVREVLEVIRPGIWDEMAESAQQMVLGQVRTELSQVAADVFADVARISNESLDLRALVVDLLSGENADRLSDLFQRMGRKELRFIVYYGGVFGLLVGVLQAVLFGVLGQWWLMPVIGVIVGLGTNWLALQMIFRPIEPRSYFGITYQGMFPKRQAEIATEYGEVAANEIFTPANLFRVLVEGPAGVEIAASLVRRVSEAIDAQRMPIEMITSTTITDEMVRDVQVLLVSRLGQRLPELRDEIEQVAQERLGVAELVSTRLADMPKLEFERLLRGIFEEDEWILIAIGGALGGAVGILQAALVLG